jgi:glycosyltransferase involved in cell wall biosynthesis
VFAGGDSMRDYGPLVEAARRLPVEVTIAAHPAAIPSGHVPANVHVGAVSPLAFFDLTRRARVVVVPLRDGICRSAGQQTYLNAMALGKLVIVTDSPGVRDYIDDGVDGVIVPARDPDALTAALEWASNERNAGAVAGITTRAREKARLRFSPPAHIESLLRVVERAATAGPARLRRRMAQA